MMKEKNKKEIKDYLKRVDELGAKLTGEDKETYTWLIYGYNQCAKLLNEKEQQVKKQKEIINKLNYIKNRKNQGASQENINKMAIGFVNSWLKEVSE